jgi:hypothetical protein
LNSELVFYFAVFFLPFENFFFAPSSGWAAITPIILAVYLALNLKYFLKTFVKLKNIFAFFIAAVIIGSITAFLNNVNLTDYINSFVPLFLGAISLLSFYIFYQKKKDLSVVINLLVISYAICAIVGLFEFLAIQLKNDSFADFLSNFFKRNYLTKNHRVQFFFTEPSFIGMHLFGILLPLYWLSRRKDLLFIILLFLFEAIAFSSGVRIIIDFVVVAILYFGFLLIKHKRARFIPLIILTLGLGFSFAYNNTPRIRKIVDAGVYADGSLASRYFRIQASLIGYTKTPSQALVGYGLGNSIYPIHKGYEKAYESYDSSYTREVDDLDNRSTTFHDDSVSYSLYTRMISEFGFIMTIIAIIYLVGITRKSQLSQRWLYFAIIMYLYIQFESLGFYALWLFIVTMLFTSKEEMSEKILLRRINDNIFRRKAKK